MLKHLHFYRAAPRPFWPQLRRNELAIGNLVQVVEELMDRFEEAALGTSLAAGVVRSSIVGSRVLAPFLGWPSR